MAVHSRIKSLENNIKPLKNDSSDIPEIDIKVKEEYSIPWGQLMVVLISIAVIVFFAIFLAKRNK
jgi:hypothetical protein